MGDFLLDCRALQPRPVAKAADFLRFFPDMRAEVIHKPGFSLVLSSSDAGELWGPYQVPEGSGLAALSGRISLESAQWLAAHQVPGDGGLACKYIWKAYAEGGLKAVEELSGNYVIVLFDALQNKLHLVTDRWGLFPAFRLEGKANEPVFASHPDALADCAGVSGDWDLTSFAEFVLAGRLSYPFTYYRRIKALPVASTTTVTVSPTTPRVESTRSYFSFEPRPQPAEKFEVLAEALAEGFKQAVAKRSLPSLGPSVVALSGGLDSRTVLCAAPRQQELLTFSCYDEPNREFRIARAIAHQAGAKFVPLQRPFDYYGNHVALGARISAGMGCIASNHFLGFRREIQELGAHNLLTGCYCDYVFKGLAINRNVNPVTTRERIGPFKFSYYALHFGAPTPLALAVRERLATLFPPELQRYDSEAAVFHVEQRRVFPLCYEEDNAERIIPQRVMGWYVPIAENALMEVYLQMSSEAKLNRRIFGRATELVCSREIAQIPDANTGAPVNASLFREAVASHLCRAEQLWRKLRPSNATSGSWLNWDSYAKRSETIKGLWHTPNREAWEVFELILGKDGFQPNISAYHGREIYLFLQLFTLKLWFDQRSR